MADADPDLLRGVAEHLRPALSACIEERLPANIVLMRLIVEARSRHEIETSLASALSRAEAQASPSAEPLRQVLALFFQHPSAYDTVKAVMAHAVHARPAVSEADSLDHWTAVFDRLAEEQPEAGVALYALGSREILEEATQELVAALEGLGLLGFDRHVLEIGCGIGRMTGALAARVASLTGTDISGRMIDEARRRWHHLQNVRLERSGGQDLMPFEAGSFDLVLAVDVFPYLVQAGGVLASRHVEEAARVLRPGGTLAILNYSYRGEPDRDRADLRLATERAGLSAPVEPALALAHWDGSAFLMTK